MNQNTNSRPYQSEIRAAGAKATRERILEAVVEVMADGPTGLSIPAVASAAGVSIPSVYRHFGNKQGLMEAFVGHVSERIGFGPEMAPTDLSEVGGAVRALFHRLEEADPLIRAALASGSSEPRAAAVEVRMGALRAWLETAEVPEAQMERLARVVVILTCSEALRLWKDRFDLSTDEVADNVGWAIHAMIRERDMSVDLVNLFDLESATAPVVGQKAHMLALVASMGFDVPDGFVVPAGAQADSLDVLRWVSQLGTDPLAVRTSAIDEDRADSSRAGHYRSFLRVSPDEVSDRIIDCRNHAEGLGPTGSEGESASLAVIVQRMVQAEAAGVAFTADPVTGDRSSVIVSATRGLGDRLLSGEVPGDEWEVVGGKARPRRRPEGVLTARQVRQVAALVSRLAELLGSPQDVEWAWDGDRIWILQARPITALPPETSWEIDRRGVFHRGLRFGEWIPEPVTPLFESWLLTEMEGKLHEVHRAQIGQVAPEPHHLVVNGWYFYSLNFLPVTARALARSLPYIIARTIGDPRRTAVMFPATVSRGYPLYEREWRQDVEPRYRQRIAAAESEVESASPTALVSLIDDLASLAGEYFASISVVAGSAYKIETQLAQFWNRHLAEAVGQSHMVLLGGLQDVDDMSLGPLVETLDWYREPVRVSPADRTVGHRLVELRQASEEAARRVLAHSPRKLARFDDLLAQAQHLQPVREQQMAGLTRSWPVMRRAALRLGEHLAKAGVVESARDVWFLSKLEVVRSLSDPQTLIIEVGERREGWQQAKRLHPPSHVGRMPVMARFMFATTASALGAQRSEFALVTGVPASPGEATGPVRLVRDSFDFARVVAGDVIVAPLTSPALASVMSKAAGLVTDVGSGLAHASIIAHEYGVPAVVGCQDATARLTEGRLVTVNGSTGVVTVASHVG